MVTAVSITIRIYSVQVRYLQQQHNHLYLVFGKYLMQFPRAIQIYSCLMSTFTYLISSIVVVKLVYQFVNSYASTYFLDFLKYEYYSAILDLIYFLRQEVQEMLGFKQITEITDFELKNFRIVKQLINPDYVYFSVHQCSCLNICFEVLTIKQLSGLDLKCYFNFGSLVYQMAS